IFLLIILFLFSTNVVANTQKLLPDSLIFLPEDSNAIVVEKRSQQVLLYTNIGTEIIERYKFSCSTGEASGNKVKSGDKKTPEGVYFIKDRYEDKDLSPIYGKKAFPIDYPNFMDKVARRSGNNIWIHGTNKILKAMDSNGCVAMENENILSFSDYITINKTPVIIVDTLSMVDIGALDSQAGMIQDWFENWVNAINNGSYHNYLSLYDASYFPKILWWKKWSDIRSKTADTIGNLTVTISDKGIYKQNGIYVIIFNMGLELLKKKVDFGTRKLFVVQKNSNYKIIGDVYQTCDNKKNCKKNAPLVAAADNLVQKIELGPDIEDVVANWLKAWTSKDMDKYASYYSRDFHSDGLNKQEWVKRKRDLATRYDYIGVFANDLKVYKGSDRITIRFVQDYKSSGFSAIGIKTLIFINEDKGWKIYRESWKKK
ncbi:MAG: L,D-transpeptidase family protein, partial [Desulfobacteraceae bacterium]|nr:L,D-transpeptidase family protein [Desulfobacteraceae bacterium]